MSPEAPAGGGPAAASFLHQMPRLPPGPPTGRPQPAAFVAAVGAVPASSSTAPAPAQRASDPAPVTATSSVPVTATSSAPVSPTGRRSSMKQRTEALWLTAFQSLAGKHNLCLHMHPEIQDKLKGCSVLAGQIEEAVIELFSVVRSTGLSVRDVAHLLRSELFDTGSHVVRGARRGSTLRGAVCAYAFKHVVGHPSQEYDLGEQVGQGTFGTVVRSRQRATGDEHAIKSVFKQKIDRDELWGEIDIIRLLDHPHIMRLYNTFEDDGKIYMAFELCHGGSFFQWLSQRGFLTEVTGSRIFRQIIGVVGYLNSRHICHRDLKPENFLLMREADADSAQLKLIDFGTAKRFDINQLTTKVCTPHYVAPEVLQKGTVPYSEKVDVWSCGVILFQMLSGSMPFHRNNDLELLRLVKKGQFEFKPEKVWSLMSDNVKGLVSSLLTTEVQHRFSADEAFHHAWVHDQQVQDDVALSNQLMKQMHIFLTNNRLKRVALQVIARQIDDESIGQLRNIFLSLDEDNSGTIGRAEMEEAVRQLDVGEMAQAGMVEIMCQLDPSGKGLVEYTEFLAATMTKEQYLREDVCRAAFLRLDADGDGTLTRKDLAKLLADKGGIRDAGLEGANLSELMSELESMLKDGDEDHDGGLNFKEFFELMADESSHFADSAVSSRRGRGRKSYTAKELFQFVGGDQEAAEDVESDDSEDFG